MLSTTELWRLLEDSFSSSSPPQKVDMEPEKEKDTEKEKEGDKEGKDSSNIEPQDMVSFLQSFVPDSPKGRDHVEALFRVISASGQQLVSAVDANTASGGFAEYLFKFAAERLFALDVWADTLEYKTGRNADTAETTLIDPKSGETLLTFSRMYGFRNIQSLVLKMKRKRLATMDYVELMACPSGCANGGGQIKTQVTEHPSEIAARVEKTLLYMHSALVVGRVEDSSLVKYLYLGGGGSGGSGGGDESKQNSKEQECRSMQEFNFSPITLFQTSYHAIPKLETVAPLAAIW